MTGFFVSHRGIRSRCLLFGVAGGDRMKPEIRQLEQLARDGFSFLPVAKEISSDIMTPVGAFLRLRSSSLRCFLLESAEGGEQIGRYSSLGIHPVAQLIGHCGTLMIEDWEQGTKETRPMADPFAELDQFLASYSSPKLPFLPPFQGGLVGYVGYNTISYLEKIPRQAQGTGAKDFNLLLFKTSLCFDKLKHKIFVISHLDIRKMSLTKAYQVAQDEMNAIISMLSRQGTTLDPIGDFENNERPEIAGMAALVGEEKYGEGVRKIKSHIRRGDIFQGVLSDRFEFPFTSDPFAVYRALRYVNPSPYLFYLSFGEETLLGSSPEMLVRSTNGRVETCPIAGTRPRGTDDVSDRKFEKSLLASAKEKAEHLMLVDLGRNDIGRVSQLGSVQVQEYMQVERFSHVMHLVSRVAGQLARGCTSWDAFRACFPAGTLTGAPKIRAMEILAELEPEMRGAYGGGIVCHDFSGSLNSCITIRSLYVNGGKGYISAGAGIVADSRPMAEYQEVLNKAQAVKYAVNMAQNMS